MAYGKTAGGPVAEGQRRPPAAADALAAAAPETPSHRFWSRTPPAIFPPILGLLGLGIAWRLGLREFGLPLAWAEIYLGGATALFLVAALAYLVKLARRPGVLADDLQLLPGRAGMGGAVLCIYSVAGVLLPYAPGAAQAVLLAGLAVHLGVAGLLIAIMRAGPAALREVTPVWHLNFAGTIVAGVVAEALDLFWLARALFVLSVPVALWVWGASLAQARRRPLPGALRPMLAIHMSPANFLGFVALGLGWNGIAHFFGLVTGAVALAALAALRWLTVSGFSPLWGAFTFPITSAAAYWLSMGGPWRHPGAVLVVLATLIVPPIAGRILWMWTTGELARRTNAATA